MVKRHGLIVSRSKSPEAAGNKKRNLNDDQREASTALRTANRNSDNRDWVRHCTFFNRIPNWDLIGLEIGQTSEFVRRLVSGSKLTEAVEDKASRSEPRLELG